MRQGKRNPSSKAGAGGRKRFQDSGSEHRRIGDGWAKTMNEHLGADSPIVSLEKARKIYRMGTQEVQRPGGGDRLLRGGQLLGDHGAQRFGKKHDDEYPRLPGPA